MNFRKVIAITGPTATGKTALAVKLAQKWGGEIVSIDSRQLYKGMDLGTGKDLEEYGDTPYHLIDTVEPTDEYNLSRFMVDGFSAIEDIVSRGKLPMLCGGTAMYLNALLRGFRLPGGALPHESKTHLRQSGSNAPSFTPPFELQPLIIGVYYPRDVVRNRIAERLESRFKAGMVEEVASLHAQGVSYEKLEFFGLEYREIARYLQGEFSFETMKVELLNRIRQFAKRQDIFFRKMEREGLDIHWLRSHEHSQADKLINLFLANQEIPPPAMRLSEIFYGKKSS